MLDAGHFEDLSSFLEFCVNKIKKSHPRYSSLQLSKKLGIPNSTFDRISKKEVKRPNFNHSLRIAQEVCGDEGVQDFIKKFYPQMFEDFNKVYPGNKDVPFLKPEAEKYFEDPNTFEIMILASSEAGLNKDSLIEEFGKRGLTTAYTLHQEGILDFDGTKFTLKGPINANQATVHKVLQNFISMNYDLDAFGDNRNWLSVQYESANLEYVIPKLREIYIKANQEIRQVFNNPLAKGNEVVWAGLAMDSLSKHKEKDSSESKGVLQ